MAKINNEQFVSDFGEFVDTATDNKDELNYSLEDEAQGTEFKASLAAKLKTLQIVQAAFDAAEADFNEERKLATEFKKTRKKYFANNPNVSTATKSKFNISKQIYGSSGVVAQPLDLTVEGFANGINTCKWKRNHNPPLRNFTVEYRIGETGAWLIAGTTRKTVFYHKNQTPGVKIYYRVYAHTDKSQSPYSNTAVVYV